MQHWQSAERTLDQNPSSPLSVAFHPEPTVTSTTRREQSKETGTRGRKTGDLTQSLMLSNRLFMQDRRRRELTLGFRDAQNRPGKAQLQRITRGRKSSRTATFIGYSCFAMCKGRRQRAGRDGDVTEQRCPLCVQMHSGTCAGDERLERARR